MRRRAAALAVLPFLSLIGTVPHERPTVVDPYPTGAALAPEPPDLPDRALLARASRSRPSPTPKPHRKFSHRMSHPQGAPPGLIGSLPLVLQALLACESGDRRHGRPVLGTVGWRQVTGNATGGPQWLNSSWWSYGFAKRYGVPRAMDATPEQQVESLVIASHNGTELGPWAASRNCWGPYA